jgi:serine/threonine-protein kinase
MMGVAAVALATVIWVWQRGNSDPGKVPPTNGPPVDPVVSNNPNTPNNQGGTNNQGGGNGQDSAKKALAFLTKYCSECHGNGAKEGGFDYVLDSAKLVAKGKVKPGDPNSSRLFQVIQNGEMPAEGTSTPLDNVSEADVLRDWIQAGAPPFPTATAAAPPPAKNPDAYLLGAIRDHLRKAPPESVANLRYFSFYHLLDDPQFKGADVRLRRAAVSKVLNSLSWERNIVQPELIDPRGALFVVDLRKIGWTPQFWTKLTAVYPYGLRQDGSRDPELRTTAAEVYRTLGTTIPYIRGDWFVTNASRPPLYHDLLQLPLTAGELERTFLRVNVQDNFLNDRLQRAGFIKSGVATQNRMVERHTQQFGAYWRSYDFKSNEGRANLLRFPLGPNFAGNPFADQAFVQDGGELIWNLPNGLQAYLLVDGQDRRIDVGATALVSDSRKTSGTAEIVNGLSCMACHDRGMIPCKDEIRTGADVAKKVLVGVSPAEKVSRLYPTSDQMDKSLQEDGDRFVKAVTKATGTFLQAEEDKGKAFQSFPEPVGLTTLRFNKELNLETAAHELGLSDPKQLAAAIKTNDTLRSLGLEVLTVDGGIIKREAWQSLAEGDSPFQQAARQLDLGEPFREGR